MVSRECGGVAGAAPGAVPGAAPGVARTEAVPFGFEGVGDVVGAFSRGLEPDLDDPVQRSLFLWHIRNNFMYWTEMGFLRPFVSEYDLHEEILEDIRRSAPPVKEPFRNHEVRAGWTHGLTDALDGFSRSQVKALGKVRANLFNIDANLGFWRKALGFRGGDGDFGSFLDGLLPARTREWLKGGGTDQAKWLHGFLVTRKGRMSAEGRDTGPVSRAIVDVVHTFGYHDPLVKEALRGPSARGRLIALRSILGEREAFAAMSGYDGFSDVLGRHGVDQPTGTHSRNWFEDTLLSLEREFRPSPGRTGVPAPAKTIRHLSLAESPYRGCLGGDCSTEHYPLLALDSRFHYFTLTGGDGMSSGQMTVVLGWAASGSRRVKAAFVDKVQGVDRADVPLMMEGVRRSVGEKGYTLVLPEDLGNWTGTSSWAGTRDFIRERIPTGRSLGRFRPRDHGGSDFPHMGYSRAWRNLAVRPVLPPGPAFGRELVPGAMDAPWRRPTGFSVEELGSRVRSLDDGDDDDKIRHMSSMLPVMDALDSKAPEARAFVSMVRGWLDDADGSSFRLRKAAFLGLEAAWKVRIDSALDFFGEEEAVHVLRELLGGPKGRDRFKTWMLRNPTSRAAVLALDRFPGLLDETELRKMFRNLFHGWAARGQMSGEAFRVGRRIVGMMRDASALRRVLETFPPSVRSGVVKPMVEAVEERIRSVGEG